MCEKSNNVVLLQCSIELSNMTKNCFMSITHSGSVIKCKRQSKHFWSALLNLECPCSRQSILHPIAIESHSTSHWPPLAAIHSWSTLSPHRGVKTLQRNPLLWPCLYVFFMCSAVFQRDVIERIFCCYLESTDNERVRLQTVVLQ